MWFLKPDERLREWHAFRKEIGKDSLSEACQKTAHLWSYAPFVNRYLDPNKSSSLTVWPDPWELLYENTYCDIAKCLGMLYTLYLSEHRPDDIELRIYKNFITKEEYNLVWLNRGKYILNLEFDAVVNKTQFNNDTTLVYRYTPEDLNLTKY